MKWRYQRSARKTTVPMARTDARMTAPWISHQRRSSGDGRIQPIRCNISEPSGDLSRPYRERPSDLGSRGG